MTGTRWLERLASKRIRGPKASAAMKARLRQKVAALPDGEARRLAEQCLISGTVRALQIEWVGTWGCGMDNVLRTALGQRMRQDDAKGGAA